MGGELLPAAPLQPCAEAPLGRGHIVTLLAPGHYARHQQASGRLVAEAPHLVVHTSGGYYPRLASTRIPCSSFMRKSHLLSFIAHFKAFNRQ